MSQALALEWSAGLLRLRALPRGEVLATATLAAPRPRRGDVALFSGPVVRLPTAQREPFLRFSAERLGGRLAPTPRVPGEGHLSPQACRVHPGGALTVIEGDHVWVLAPGQTTWVARPLPAGVSARDASLAPDGSLWIAGGAPGPSGRPEAVLLRLRDHGSEVVSPALAAEDRHRLAEREADEEYGKVDVEGTPIVVVASCAWIFDDLTEFALVGWEAGWTLLMTKDQTISSWVRDRGLTCYTTDGLRVRVAAHGEPPLCKDLRRAMREAWPGGAPSGDLSVRAVRARPFELLVVVAVHDWRLPEPLPLQGCAVFRSADDGASFDCWAHTTGRDVELFDAVWL